MAVADPEAIIKKVAKKNKGFSDPKNADRFRLKTQETRATRGTLKLKNVLTKDQRAHQKQQFKDERKYEHGLRRQTRTHLREESVRRQAEVGAIRDAQQRSYMQFRTEQQLQASRARMQQRYAFEQGTRPSFLQRNVGQPAVGAVEQPIQSTSSTIAGGFFRMFAMIFALSMLYLLVTHANPSAGAIGQLGAFLSNLTQTKPLVTVKSKQPL